MSFIIIIYMCRKSLHLKDFRMFFLNKHNGRRVEILRGHIHNKGRAADLRLALNVSAAASLILSEVGEFSSLNQISHGRFVAGYLQRI